MQFNASRILGPGLGGLALLFGVGWCFFINAVSFLGVIAAMLLMRNPPAARPVHESMGQSLRTGLGYIWGRADLLTMLSLVVIGGLTGGVISRLQPVIVSQVFHGTRNTFVAFQVCFGIGAVLGAALVAYRTRHGLMSPWRAFLLMTMMAACVFALGFGGPPWLGAAVMVLAGMLFVAAMVRLNGAVLNSTPADMQGRVSSFQVLAFRSGTPVGSLGGGALAHRIGAGLLLHIVGAGLLAVIALLAAAARWKKVVYAGAAPGSQS
jgi:predicted MFS family arabinose efflux permease